MHFLAISALIAGCASILIGLVDIVTALKLRRRPIRRNLIIGSGFVVLGIVLLGLLLAWLSGAGTLHIYLGPQGNQIGTVLLVVFGFGMFILKSVMNIREGQAKLKEADASQFSIWKSRLQSFSGVFMLVFVVILLALFFSQILK